jgi:hypothetical protein
VPGVRITMDKSSLEKLQRSLSLVDTKTAKNTLKRAVTAAAAQVRDNLRAVEPRRTGGLAKGTKSRSTRGGGAEVYGEHPRAAHAHIVRKGTKDRKTRKGQNRGAMPSNAAMQGVLDRAGAGYADSVLANVSNDLVRLFEKGT